MAGPHVDGATNRAARLSCRERADQEMLDVLTGHMVRGRRQENAVAPNEKARWNVARAVVAPERQRVRSAHAGPEVQSDTAHPLHRVGRQLRWNRRRAGGPLPGPRSIPRSLDHRPGPPWSRRPRHDPDKPASHRWRTSPRPARPRCFRTRGNEIHCTDLPEHLAFHPLAPPPTWRPRTGAGRHDVRSATPFAGGSGSANDERRNTLRRIASRVIHERP